MIEIQLVKIENIKPYANNPRNIDSAIEAVKNSIKEFGMKVPIVIDKDNVIITGHTRYAACQELGFKEIPCIKAEDLNEQQVKAFRLADNKVAEMSSWNFDLLEEELSIIDTDMSLFGFEFDADASITTAENQEINLDDFDDESFEYECPECGFRFNA